MIALNMTIVRREAPHDGGPQPEGQTRCECSIGVGTMGATVMLSLATPGASMSIGLDYQTAELVQLALEKALEEALLADPTDQELADLMDDPDLDADDYDPPAAEAQPA